jgi:drug/metabolite transporter (DMT)-like permease
MPASALGLALAAALVHALWNVLLARARETEAATVVALASAVLVFAPVTAAVWRVDAAVWPYLLGSSALELGYFALLVAAYRRAELSLVYPLARGAAPVFVLAIGVAVLGTRTSGTQVAGVCLVGAGVLLVRGLRTTADARGIALALAVAVCIAGYTLVDKHGIRHANPIVYLELVLVPTTIAYGVWVWATRGLRPLRSEVRFSSIAAGAATFGGYVLVLAALRLASAASVAAVRETSVVIATALAALVLKERVSPTRMAGAIAVAAGVALVSL